MMATYGFTIKWTTVIGDRITFGVNGCKTCDEAKQQALEIAKDLGWTRPKWWQWWRRNDTKITGE